MADRTPELTGIHIPLITPFTAQGGVALEALEALAHEALDAGAAGIVALGTTAEAATLDPEERTAVRGLCARVCQERGAVLIVGAGNNDTRAAELALGELAAGCAEAAAALVPVPAFSRPSEAGVLAHFGRLAAASPLPLVVYHVPYRTARPLGAATLRALSGLPGICGVKLASGSIDQDTVELFADPLEGFSILVGDDAYLSPLLALGASGGILASAQLATARYVELAAAWRDGDLPRARALGHRLALLSAAAFREPNPTVIKAVLHAQGCIPTPDVRLPLLPAARDSADAVLRLLTDLEQRRTDRPEHLDTPSGVTQTRTA